MKRNYRIHFFCQFSNEVSLNGVGPKSVYLLTLGRSKSYDQSLANHQHTERKSKYFVNIDKDLKNWYKLVKEIASINPITKLAIIHNCLNSFISVFMFNLSVMP